ncbi:ABC transporter permease subunit [Psychrobium sp. nBUS_13]|uniref:ABC transporter permease subunit n=1 Tax=Psychrobium sp. nBUS_13 TaxID=3395319 RepID=UPI003EB76AE1
MQPTTTAPQQGAMRSVWLISQFELTRLFLTKRGAVLLAAFAIVWFLILKYPVSYSVGILANESFGDNITMFSSQLNLDYLLQWAYSEVAVYWLFAIFIFPFIAVLMTSDQTASDATRGTIRFLLLRTSRNQLLFGRFIGQLIIISILIALTMFAAFAMGVWREPSLALAAIPQLLLVASNLVLVCLPFIALMALFNSWIQSSKLSVVFTIILLPIVTGIISWLSGHISVLEHLLMAIPGVQLTDTVQMASFQYSSITIPLVQTAAYLGLAQFVLTRKAL